MLAWNLIGIYDTLSSENEFEEIYAGESNSWS